MTHNVMPWSILNLIMYVM